MRAKTGVLIGFAVGFMVALSIAAVTWTPGTGNYTVVGGATNAVSEPTIVSTTTNAVVLEATAGRGSPENFRFRTIQNVGTVAVLYRLGGTASAANYHGVLAPGLAARDGLGSVLDVSSWRGSVSIAVESGTGSVATLELIR